MLHLSAADILQLLFHVLSGIFVLFQTTFHPWLEKVSIFLAAFQFAIYTTIINFHEALISQNCLLMTYNLIFVIRLE
uniref:Transmembrane protein 107 n=1 Tax=Parascaris equorum TaxID=6256 RepID=A0A914REW3_PAREQ